MRLGGGTWIAHAVDEKAKPRARPAHASHAQRLKNPSCADGDAEAHHFDAACVSGLCALRTLTLTEFHTVDLGRLPTALTQLDLLVYHNEPVCPGGRGGVGWGGGVSGG